MSDRGDQEHARDSELRRRRDELAEQVAELHWNLGGLAYEMAIRDHFRLDVLVRRAGILQERDAELAEIERLLRMQESGGAGNCASCGAVRSRGAVFCWQCGAQVMERTPVNGDFGRQNPPDDRSTPASPVAAPAGRDRASGSEPEGIGNDAEKHPLDMLAAVPKRDDRGESQPIDDLARPVQTGP
jgi:hypothetical protein